MHSLAPKPLCRVCGDDIDPPERAYVLLKSTCLFCGEDMARAERRSWCIAPMHKSNYLFITNPADLLGINNKGGLVK